MKPAFSYPAITIISLVFSAVCSAQNNQPAHPPVQTDPVQTITTDTLKKINSTPGIAAPANKDSLKTKKATKRRKKKEFDYTLYQINDPDPKPLPHNNNRETKKEPDKEGPGAAIIRAILNNNKHN